MNNPQITIISPVDFCGFLCTTRDPEYASTEDLDFDVWCEKENPGEIILNKRVNFEPIYNGVYQDWVSGTIEYTQEDFEFETAVELWRYRQTFSFSFIGTRLGNSIFIHSEDVKLESKVKDSCCVRDFQAEAEERFFLKQEQLLAAA